MNRREAIAALVSLPPSTRVSVASLKPDDVIVIECDDHITQDTAERIKQTIERVWPGRKCVVLTETLKLKIVAGSSTGGAL